MPGRQDRVNAAIRKEIGELLLYHMTDPRLQHVTVTSVSVTRDWSFAKVYVSTLGDEAQLRDAVEALNKAAGFVRTQIAPRLTLRHVPQLQFYGDDTARKAQRLEQIFREEHRPDDEA